MVSFIFGKPARRQIVLYLLQIRTLSQTTDDMVGKREQIEYLHIFVSLEDQIKSSCNSICHICEKECTVFVSSDETEQVLYKHINRGLPSKLGKAEIHIAIQRKNTLLKSSHQLWCYFSSRNFL